MIEETDDVLAFVIRYLRPFCKGLYEAVGQTRETDHGGVVAGDPLAGMMYEVFGRLKQRYTLQEHEKGGPLYIWRIAHDLKGKGRKRLKEKNARGGMQADERRKWDALKDYYIEVGERKQLKDPEGAASRRLRRYRAAGMRPEDIVVQLHDDPKPAE